MYIDIVWNRSSRPAILRRESVREGKRIIKRTIANLSALSLQQAEAIRAVLKGEALAPAGCPFKIIRSRAHGAVKAIASAMSHLRLLALLDRKPSRERDLVLAMIAARVLESQSKLATSRSWGHSTLVTDCDALRQGSARETGNRSSSEAVNGPARRCSAAFPRIVARANE
jgi:hypothetical protein